MVAPVNPTLQPLEMIPVVRNSSPKVIFVENGICYDRLREALSSLQLEFEETQQGKDEKIEQEEKNGEGWQAPLVVSFGEDYESFLMQEEEREGGDSLQSSSSMTTTKDLCFETKNSPPPPSMTPWLCLHTSGTTSVPKGVLHAEESIRAGALTHPDLCLTSRDSALISWPMHGINPAFFCYHFLYLGASIHPLPLDWYGIDRHTSSPLKYLKGLVETQASFISLSPAHFQAILALPQKEIEPLFQQTRPGLKVLLTGAKCHEHLKRRIAQLLLSHCPGSILFEAYGSTEAGLVSLLQPEDVCSHALSVGRETPGISLSRILDRSTGEEITQPGSVGDLFVQTPMLCQGYYQNPQANQKSFVQDPELGRWYRTGDLASRDKEGYLYLHGRSDSVIPLGHGWNVMADEVESRIAENIEVKEVAVLGVEKDERSCTVTAVVVPSSNGALLSVESLCQRIIDSLATTLAEYKHPQEIIVASSESLPRSLNQKIQYSHLSKMIQTTLPEEWIVWNKK
eukprot:CAMPEP_0201480056 /NCGR_PEP_ID=MMETSP0151_2-20130828/4637_1 /ASSEMBLY_ACC=CAM_ASM_000257 /TAXON_ID=200890 /ORGANISM="Paramoeba atlantica, Strain 621/1 / CCAP 1560/9" /LENGTH=512 /DNA_ID=CAMNT_0047861807 /DNA_START=363 /DNA_END=1901 /DNA_ORIENTATION=-